MGPRSYVPWRMALPSCTPPTTWNTTVFLPSVGDPQDKRSPRGTRWPVHRGLCIWTQGHSFRCSFAEHTNLKSVTLASTHSCSTYPPSALKKRHLLLLGHWTVTKFNLLSGQERPLLTHSWIPSEAWICYHLISQLSHYLVQHALEEIPFVTLQFENKFH